MEKFYAVVETGLYGIRGQWYYKTIENARVKFNEIGDRIKERWGYGHGDPDDWVVSENKVEFYSRDDSGDDDFMERVELTEVKFED